MKDLRSKYKFCCVQSFYIKSGLAGIRYLCTLVFNSLTDTLPLTHILSYLCDKMAHFSCCACYPFYTHKYYHPLLVSLHNTESCILHKILLQPFAPMQLVVQGRKTPQVYSICVGFKHLSSPLLHAREHSCLTGHQKIPLMEQ